VPVRNVVRYQAPNTFYHVYNRGHNRELLFSDGEDYTFFMWLLERCYGPVQLKSKDDKLFPWFGDQVSLHSFCLMPNHFHLLMHQGDDTGMLSKSMQSLATTYSMYFNKKYKRRGSIFESVFKASPILNESYLQHITRYIHLNPKDFKNWPHSSYGDYLGRSSHSWVISDRILSAFDSTDQYKQFVDDYVDLRNELEALKYELADHRQTYYET
jgi:putative transposase